MSDNTELTFIRCPSCRSLVPALSTRCRMCGASLDKAAAPAKPAAKPVEVPKTKQVAAAVGEEVDPLADYLSELEADNSAAEEEVSEPAKQEDADSNDDDEEALNELEKLLEELKSAEEGVDEISEEPEPEPAPVKAKAPAAPVAKKAVPSKPVQIASQHDIDDAVDEFSDSDEVMEDFNDAEEPVVAKPKPVSNGFKKPAEVTVSKPAAPLRSKAVKPPAAPVLKPVTSKPASVAKPVAPRATAPGRAIQHALVGWFVSFSDSGEVSMELRSGRYFISRNKIKGHDILIDDESISTPHAMLILDSESGVQVQDLLSEEGVFVRRAGSQDYEQVEDLEILENGDWVRFGNVEYLLVLVPAGAR